MTRLSPLQPNPADMQHIWIRFRTVRRITPASLFAAILLFAGAALAADAKPVEARRPMFRPKVGPLLKLPAVFQKAEPQTPNDLVSMESHVSGIVGKLMKSTVGVRIGAAQGSGVIVSPDGFILTAGHVSGAAGRPVTVIFPDGKTARGITLGANHGIDSGLIRITDKGRWPYLNIGRIKDLKTGDWCIATGHPGGYKPGRPPVVRLGRVIQRSGTYIRTDATLVGGDSGGPLFDMHGRVIGINSRIGALSTQNIHVPIATYDEEWEPLALSKVWGSRFGRSNRAQFGINGADDPKGCRVTAVPNGLPAARAGLKVNDILTKFDGQPIKSLADLKRLMSGKRPGNRVVVEVLRNGQVLKFTVTLDRH